MYYAGSGISECGKRGWSAVIRHQNEVPFPSAEQPDSPPAESHGTAENLVKRLLAGPDNVRLSDGDDALLCAFLQQPGNRCTLRQLAGKEHDRLAKVRLIYTYNNNLRVTPPPAEASPRSCPRCGLRMSPKDYYRNECHDCRRKDTIPYELWKVQSLDELKKHLRKWTVVRDHIEQQGRWWPDIGEGVRKLVAALHRLQAPFAGEIPSPAPADGTDCIRVLWMMVNRLEAPPDAAEKESPLSALANSAEPIIVPSVPENVASDSFDALVRLQRQYEGFRAQHKELSDKVSGPPVRGSTSAAYAIEANKHYDASQLCAERIQAIPGIGRIRAICESESGKFDVETLVRIRGKLGVALDVGTDELDAFEVNHFVEQWRREFASGTAPKGSPKKRGPKKKDETRQRAEFSKGLIMRGEEWPEIYKKYRETYPYDQCTDDTIRQAYNREYPAT